MDRRVFVKTLAGVVAGLKAAGMIEISSVPAPPSFEEFADETVGAIAEATEIPREALTAEPGTPIMLPTEGIVELNLRRHVIEEISYHGDFVDDVILSAPEVEIRYETPGPFVGPHVGLLDVMVEGHVCRLEFHHMRIDGIIVSMLPEQRGRWVYTEVILRPTAAVEYDESIRA